MKYLTRSVWILSLVSFFTDISSEMLYPVMPLYLKSIGFTVVAIGILEGLAEAVSGISKGYFGERSDNIGKRLPFVRFGYLLSALSKPMMAVFTNVPWIFGARTMDRLGKGIRTAARDAMLSDESTPANKGKVFGFHRSMDTLGAVFGPVSALVFLYFYPGQYKTLFFIAFIPGMLAVVSTYLLREKQSEPKQKRTSFLSFTRYFGTAPAPYKKLVAGLLAFTLFNSSDVFLLLKLKESGVDDAHLIGMYIFYNLVYAFCAFPLGILADKLGLKKIFITGLLLFAATYAGMSFISSETGFIILFALYGMYSAATEGVSKAWISNVVDRSNTATAIGTYTAFNSICSLLASVAAGLIWNAWGPVLTFLISGCGVAVIALYMMTVKYSPHTQAG